MFFPYRSKIWKDRRQMVSVALMIGGAVLNATAFIGGSYLAKMLGGNDADEERKRHDLALEKYQRDYQRYVENKEKLESWLEQRRDNEDRAADKFKSTDEALKYYNRMHLGGGDTEIMRAAHEPKFSEYYSPSQQQKNGEMLYVGGGMLALGFGLSKLF